MTVIGNARQFWLRKLEDMLQLETYSSRFDNIADSLNGIWLKGGYWINLIYDRHQCRAVLSAVMNLQVA
jgi:hypothetical protein